MPSLAALDRESGQLRADIAAWDQERMYWNYSNPERAGALKARVRDAQAALARLQHDRLQELLTLVPASAQAAVGGRWLLKYRYDRLAPIATSLDAGQRMAHRRSVHSARRDPCRGNQYAGTGSVRGRHLDPKVRRHPHATAAAARRS